MSLAKPIDVIVKLNLFEKTVSPPLREYFIFYFVLHLSDLVIFDKLDLEKFFLLPDPDIK